MNPLSLIFGFGSDLIKRIFPDKDKQEEAKELLSKMHLEGDLKKYQLQMSAIVAEAKSKDKWTSRARPSFLYVMYAMILASIPMGILYAFNPDVAHNISTGMSEWLASIPKYMWTVFGFGYTGYVAGRSYDKKQIISN